MFVLYKKDLVPPLVVAKRIEPKRRQSTFYPIQSYKVESRETKHTNKKTIISYRKSKCVLKNTKHNDKSKLKIFC
jgi:hypothetical protein